MHHFRPCPVFMPAVFIFQRALEEDLEEVVVVE
jgi:hypothetical protein